MSEAALSALFEALSRVEDLLLSKFLLQDVWETGCGAIGWHEYLNLEISQIGLARTTPAG